MAGLGSNPQETIRLLEELAANAWPSPVQQQLEGWKLRAAGGLTRRANSVYTCAPMPRYPHWLREARRFYARWGLPTRFQISDGSPHELEDLLDALGYTREAHSEVQVAGAADVVASTAGAEALPVVATSRLEENWLKSFIRVEGHDPALTDKYRAIMSAIGPEARFAAITLTGETVGIGMAVTERGWSGLFNIATAPHMRGRGVATAIVGELARWS
ncbi:MAG: hypothetical protein M3328_09420, partial [Chloroflexota bacterium]|nr:hypothetical protein [Chloroflexota bacterium]